MTLQSQVSYPALSLSLILHTYPARVPAVEPPAFVELEVTSCPPNVKGNTASGGCERDQIAVWSCEIRVWGGRGEGQDPLPWLLGGWVGVGRLG